VLAVLHVVLGLALVVVGAIATLVASSFVTFVFFCLGELEDDDSSDDALC
jgi:hypothetical protein